MTLSGVKSVDEENSGAFEITATLLGLKLVIGLRDDKNTRSASLRWRRDSGDLEIESPSSANPKGKEATSKGCTKKVKY